MTASATTENKPLWLLMEEKILGLSSEELSKKSREATIHRIAGELDNAGHNVSCHGGNLLQLRWAVGARLKSGRPLMQDFNRAVAALKLEDVTDPWKATIKLMDEIGEAWPEFNRSERRPDVLRIIEKARIDLLVARAKELSGDEGVRFLYEEGMEPKIIIEALSISEEKFGQVKARIEAERAERARVKDLLKALESGSNEEKVKRLISNKVSEKLIIEMAGVDRAAVDSIKRAMEAELKEKQRLEEAAAAKRAAEAAGPPLEEIPPDDLLRYIGEIRNILEFSDIEKEIRGMCEQSSIPKCLVDIAVSEPGRLDELEKKAEG